MHVSSSVREISEIVTDFVISDYWCEKIQLVLCETLGWTPPELKSQIYQFTSGLDDDPVFDHYHTQSDWYDPNIQLPRILLVLADYHDLNRFSCNSGELINYANTVLKKYCENSAV